VTDRDLTGPGTPESTWAAASLPGRLPVLGIGHLLAERVVLVAPHPDDEVLGAGGILALLAARGCAIHVVAVTDGEASHPGRAEELRRVRAAERDDALPQLGLGEATVARLHLPDGGVRADRVREALRPLLVATDLVLAPWEHDGHPDHDACGAAVAGLPGRHWSYLVWAWHWAGVQDVPWGRSWRVPLPADTAAAKRRAVDAFPSQLEGPDPILPTHVLDRLLRDDEVLLR
jgi:LmbE family N-acetylglucosaminyl deacetylase